MKRKTIAFSFCMSCILHLLLLHHTVMGQWSLMKNQTSVGILSFLAYFHNGNKSLKRFVP